MSRLSPAAPRFELARGLDVVLGGSPEQTIDEGPRVSSVALIVDDYPGPRFDVLVEPGDPVRLGEPLLRGREHPQLTVASPGTGIVTEVERGRRRVVRSVVVALDGDGELELDAWSRAQLSGLRSEDVEERLLASGLWTAFRPRPFGGMPRPGTRPHALFVTAVDTNPLAALPEVVLEERAQDFRDGLEILTRLHDGPIYVCKRPGVAIDGEGLPRVTVAEFAGPHPAGLPGTHMHFLDPVSSARTNWHAGYQDVAAIGRHFTTGRPAVERVVALAGPHVMRPRLVRTRLGANLDDLVRGELREGPCRVVSGSVLSGRDASGRGGHLGRHHLAVAVLGAEHTALRGRPGPMIPVESFERVMPLDLLIAPLLRALVTGDVEAAEALGCLELDEEDLALCSFVCPGKLEYGVHLRSLLDEITRRG